MPKFITEEENMGDNNLSEGLLPIIWIIGKFEGNMLITTRTAIYVVSFMLELSFIIFVISFQGVQDQEELHNANSWSYTQIFVILVQEMFCGTK